MRLKADLSTRDRRVTRRDFEEPRALLEVTGDSSNPAPPAAAAAATAAAAVPQEMGAGAVRGRLGVRDDAGRPGRAGRGRTGRRGHCAVTVAEPRGPTFTTERPQRSTDTKGHNTRGCRPPSPLLCVSNAVYRVAAKILVVTKFT